MFCHLQIHSRHGFDGNESVLCIFASSSSKFGDETVKSMHKFSEVLSRCRPLSSNLGDERVKSMHDLSAPLFCHGQLR